MPKHRKLKLGYKAFYIDNLILLPRSSGEGSRARGITKLLRGTRGKPRGTTKMLRGTIKMLRGITILFMAIPPPQRTLPNAPSSHTAMQLGECWSLGVAPILAAVRCQDGSHIAARTLFPPSSPCHLYASSCQLDQSTSLRRLKTNRELGFSYISARISSLPTKPPFLSLTQRCLFLLCDGEYGVVSSLIARCIVNSRYVF
jgi:hypothetical protein